MCVKSTEFGVNGSLVVTYSGLKVRFMTYAAGRCFPGRRLIRAYGNCTTRSKTAVALARSMGRKAGSTSIVCASM